MVGVEFMSRVELMDELNELLDADFNWGRLNKLDLERLVVCLRKQKYKY